MSHNTHEGIRNLSHVSSISLALLFFYFITYIYIYIYTFFFLFNSGPFCPKFPQNLLI